MNRILQKRIVPVAVIDHADDAEPLAEALQKGGLDLIEVTFRTPAAEESIRRIRRAFPSMLVGAGTILEVDQLRRARDAGAQFGVAPGLNENVVAAARDAGLPFVPGVMTPSEVESALALGCKLQKFFPAEVAGGLNMLKALAGPYGHTGVKFIPLGGVNVKTAPAYLALPMVAAVGGSWIAERKLIADRQWAAITALASEAVAMAGATRP
jgi:2-dehydro-3-deoxyphosphogluconate aldolase/(4S)-4-hydroxy-2-oxoglutarate aldolase